MTGGKLKRNTTPITAAREAEEVRLAIDAQSARVELARRESDKASAERDEITRRLQQNRISAASLEPLVDAKQAKYEKLKNDLVLLAPDELSETFDSKEIDDTVIRLNKAYSDRDSITSGIKAKREQRLIITSEIDRKEQQIRQLRKDQEREQDTYSQNKYYNELMEKGQRSMRSRSTRAGLKRRLRTICRDSLRSISLRLNLPRQK